jgi:acylphosphatase
MGHQAGELRADFRVRGRVQGVGFRWYTVRLAGRLGLRGWVRNCSDGSVEIRAAGSAESLERFRQGLIDGPPHASVEAMEEIPERGHLPPDFRVAP